MKNISKNIIIDELLENSHIEKVEDVIFWALQAYYLNNKHTIGSAISFSIINRILESEKTKEENYLQNPELIKSLYKETKNLNSLSKEIHSTNINNGFYEYEKNIGEMLCLIHSEVSEALESDRKNIYTTQPTKQLHTLNDSEFKSEFTSIVKDSFEDEIADSIIRLLDLCAYKNIDIEEHIKLKIRYNSLREYKHGKKY